MFLTNERDFHGDFFTATVSYGVSSTPMYFDYMHLVFWFFFLTVFLISLWLSQTFYFLIRGSDRLFLIRETRGFSRAQTGDTLTAIIPMTWSITMLMHASVHSSNFDENTDSTTFSLNVLAYQWGWNYFFPKDIFIKSNFSYDNFFKKNIITNTNNIKKPTIIESGLLNINPSINFFLSQSDIIPLNLDLTIDNIDNTEMIIETPVCSEDIDPEFFSNIEYPEVSSTRLSIVADSRNVSLFGGLTHRLYITSGLVLPSDTAIHIICGSKDVIHSWAIPGLFIKIDCIPGYNCHRRLLIRWRGLFWGQCMEVCGRYHHWMPILIKTTHYDLFILWLASINNK